MKSLIATLAFGLLVAFAGPGVAATEIQRVVSPKGIEAWLVEDDTVPLIAMSFAFVGGAAQDPVNQPGLANMLSGLLDEGAGPLDSKAFQAALDEFSIELSFDAGRDAFYGSLKTLVENRDDAAKLVKLALSKPRFDAEPLGRLRDQILSGIKRNELDPEDVASRAVMEAAFPGHAYGRPLEGTLDSVAAITADDLRTFFGRIVAQNNLKVAVVGAIDAETLGRVLDEIFGDLPIKSNLTSVVETAPAVGNKVSREMAIPQTIIRFAGKGLKRDDPDFIAASVASHILGGGSFSSRLYEEVREKRGLAYSVSLSLAPFDYAGAIMGGTSTRAEKASDVIALIESELERFATEGPTAAELAAAKSYLIGSYPLRFNTSTKIANQLLNIQLDDLGIDYIDRRNGLIEAVTIDDVRRVAKRLFGNGDFIVVRVGQPES